MVSRTSPHTLRASSANHSTEPALQAGIGTAVVLVSILLVCILLTSYFLITLRDASPSLSMVALLLAALLLAWLCCLCAAFHMQAITLHRCALPSAIVCACCYSSPLVPVSIIQMSKAHLDSNIAHVWKPIADTGPGTHPPMISALASAVVFPHSSVMMVAMSSAFSRIMSCHLQYINAC